MRSIDVNPLAPRNHAEPGRKHSNGEQPAITAEFTEPQPADPGQYSSAGSLHSYQPNAPFGRTWSAPAQVQALLGHASIDTAARYFRAGSAENAAVIERIFDS